MTDEGTLPTPGSEEPPTERFPSPLWAPAPPEIDGYRLLQRIGKGGMGEVWEAEQLEPIRRRVALKLIKPGMDTEQVIVRFEAERQALALMSHSAIARVLDAGATPGGRPYFVMELVRGEPITRFCDRHRLTIHDRLELFLKVCDGVQHAHQNAVIHRDVKPSNVLVTYQDDRPVPKIIDFGIAKAVAGRLADRTLFTRFGEFLGTPEYMSPEQLAGKDDVDTRTDVYALGVMLYELLAGTLPHDASRLRELGPEDLRRRLLESEPPRPSTRLSRLGAESDTAATNRSTEPRRLVSLLEGDLDWIVGKAMEKDRVRRYASVSELAADVRRHLDDEPVLAGAPGAGYRLGKFARRHRGPLLAAGLVVLVLLGGILGTTLGLLRARAEAREARTQAAIAQAVNAFLNDDLLAAVSPEEQGRDVSMREVL
ncbi:MAG: serine/threonine-protein kinase, partial [Thermoanaerobaculia bacterium]|nr:serine/threonine-protein kinase [Thermoanaerobaculia bacterium]